MAFCELPSAYLISVFSTILQQGVCDQSVTRRKKNSGCRRTPRESVCLRHRAVSSTVSQAWTCDTTEFFGRGIAMSRTLDSASSCPGQLPRRSFQIINRVGRLLK